MSLLVLGLLNKVLLAIVLLIALGVAFVFVPNLIFYIFGAALLIGAFVYIRDDKIKAVLALLGVGVFLAGFIGAQFFSFVPTGYDVSGSVSDSRCVASPEPNQCSRQGNIEAKIGTEITGYLSYQTGKELGLPESNGIPYLYVAKQGCAEDATKIECYKIAFNGQTATRVIGAYLSAIRTDDGMLGASQSWQGIFPPGHETSNEILVYIDGTKVETNFQPSLWVRDDYSSNPDERTDSVVFQINDASNIPNGLHSLELRWHYKWIRNACSGTNPGDTCGCTSCDAFGGSGDTMPERYYEFEKTFFMTQVFLYKVGETGPVCGNGVCESGENTTNCSQDCGSNVFCGDGSCNGSETPNTCAIDCPVPPTCGNSVCDALETPTNCSQDCGSPCIELGNPPEGCLQSNWNAVHCEWNCNEWDVGKLPLSCLTNPLAVTQTSLGEKCKVIDPTTGQPRNATTWEIVAANIWWFTILTAFLLVISIGGWYLTRKR